MRYIRIILISVLLITGCSNPLIEENRELATVVMAIHDEAMAKMTAMHELRLRLQEQEKKVGKTPETTEAIAALKTSHKAMMTWMHSYTHPKTKDALETARDYLLAEKTKIEQVHFAINKSIIEAESIMAGGSP